MLDDMSDVTMLCSSTAAAVEAMNSLTPAIAALIAVFALTDFGPFRFTRIVLRLLGRTQALGLESDS